VLLTSVPNCTVPADPTVAVAGVTVTTTLGAGKTVIWKEWVPTREFTSAAEIAKLKVPASLGFPESAPVVPLRASPAGSCPEEIVKRKGAVPPLTVNAPL
jgi:hypothetical protein